MSFFEPDFLQFFKDLAPNNNKDWFDANRKRYEEIVKIPFKKFVQHVISEMAKKDCAFKSLEAKDCIFRINRDVRFSKDKQPYKLMVSAIISPNGKKDRAINGVYFELTPEHVRVYGGVYEIEKEDLYIAREAIVNQLSEFKKAIENPMFVSVFQEIHGEKNKIIPKEFKVAAEKQPLIFNKQWYFYATFPANKVLENDLDKLILDCYDAGRPVEHFFQTALGH
jgi:uncharacterized protein (TIGR02453 family)